MGSRGLNVLGLMVGCDFPTDEVGRHRGLSLDEQG